MTSTPTIPRSDQTQGFQKVVALLQRNDGIDIDQDNPLPVLDLGIFFEISKGNVSSHQTLTLTGTNPRTGQVFEDIWGAGAFTELDYDGQTGNFTPGLTVTGTNSGATGIIVIDDDAGDNGTLLLKELDGIFEDDEPITDTDTGAAVANGTTSDILEMVYPTANETWEILSGSANDTSAGTGARTVLIPYLDNSYAIKTVTATLNGTTPVTLNSDMFRVRTAFHGANNSGIIVVTAGTSKINEGDIIIRDSSSKNIRSCILAGDGIAEQTHYTVPAGKTSYVIQRYGNINKNEDVTGEPRATNGTDGIFRKGVTLNLYQTSFEQQILLPRPLVEKTDLKILSKSSNTLAISSLQLKIIEVDN
jgi:hypothetical protein